MGSKFPEPAPKRRGPIVTSPPPPPKRTRAAPAPPSPSALSIDQLAELLSKAGGRKIAAADLERFVAAGAPTNGDGTIHLIHLAAWLAARVP